MALLLAAPRLANFSSTGIINKDPTENVIFVVHEKKIAKLILAS